MRSITNANSISIDTGFGFARNTDAGMGDVRCGAKERTALHLRLYTKRSHLASPAASGKCSAQRVEHVRQAVVGVPPTSPGLGQKVALSGKSLRPNWCQQRVAITGPSVSRAFVGIS